MTSESTDSPDGGMTTTTRIATPRGPLTAVTCRAPTSNTWWHAKYPVESLDDIEAIRSVPWQRPTGLSVADRRNLPEAFAQRGILRTHISSPFVCVAGMMRYERFLELCATDFELIRALTQQCFDRIMDTLDVRLADGGIEVVWMGGCEWLTPPMGSPWLYDELVQAFEARIIERCHAAGALVHVHCHGKVRSTLQQAIARGTDFFEPVEPPPDGDIAFAEAKALTSGRMTLGGNVEARVLENETPEAVERATRAAFEGGRQRMVLRNSACPISTLTPNVVANYHRMIDVWEELSPI